MNSALDIDLFRNYCPHPHAWRAFIDDARYLLMMAGRRGAKTHTGARRMLRMIYGHDLPKWINQPYDPGAVKRGTATWWDRRPRMHYWVVADTYALLKEPKRYLLEFLPNGLLEHANARDNTLWLKPDILIEFKSGRDHENLVGSGLNGLWVEEAARMSSVAWTGFMFPLLSDHNGWAQFTTTPLGQDWTYEHIEKPAISGDKEYAFHHWVTADNIRAPFVVQNVEKARQRLPPEYFRREYEASRDAFIGQIYPFHDRMIQDIPRGLQLTRRLGGQDWGFTAPGAHIPCGLTNEDPNLAHLWALDETYDASQLVESFWIPAVKAHMETWQYKEVVADPAEPDNIQRFKKAGMKCVGHKNYTTSQYDEHERSVRAGIRVMAALMHQGRFHVHPRCKNLIRELRSYRWEQNKDEVPIEKPARGQSDHAATATRYVATYGLKGAKFTPLEIAA